METLKNVSLTLSPFKANEVLRVTLHVTRNVPYVSSDWPALIGLWLSRRYHVLSSYFSIHGDDSFALTALIVCDEDFFRQWSYRPLLRYIDRIIK